MAQMFKQKLPRIIVSKFVKLKSTRKPLFALLMVMATAFLAFFFYSLVFWGRIYPNVSVAGIRVGGLSPEKALNLLASSTRPPTKITLLAGSQSFEIPLEAIEFSYDYTASARAAYYLARSGNVSFDFYKRLRAPFSNTEIGLRAKIDEEKLGQNLSVIAGQVAIEPVLPSVKLEKGAVFVHRGLPGMDVNLKLLRAKIAENLAFAKDEPIQIPIATRDPTLSETQAKFLKKRAEKLIGKTLSLSFEDNLYSYKDEEIFDLLNPPGGYKEDKIDTLIAGLAKDTNREPANPTFIFAKGKVSEFAPAKDGVTLDKDLLKGLIYKNLQFIEASDEKTISFEIPVKFTPPELRTEDVNTLGIKELIGRGTSRFRGSIASRVHNISFSSSRFNGVLVKPGQVFSFNDILGDVSVYTGYKQAYIIKDGKTVLGDGGGVCQVSTTLFRAVLDAGLPIVERRAHSYRVAYYEQDSLPGFDATVYAPTTDLKFKNDTPGHILIQTLVDPKNARLVFEIYGTSDGRVSMTSKPVVTNVVPPPDDLYQDDPTLAAGTIKQVDWKAWGAKVRFNYEVKRGGETVYQKTFYSNYRPWQAVYLRGTGPVQ